jgi:hypothetical protein
MTLFARTTCLGLLLCGLILNSGLSAGEPQRDLIAGLKPVASILSGREASFSLQGDLQIPIDGSRQPVDMQLSRYDATSFDLQLSHPEYAVTLRRRADVTVLILPKHGTAFVARGAVPPSDSLAPEGVVGRMISSASDLGPVSLGLTMLSNGNVEDTLKALASIAKLELTSETGEWKTGDAVISFPKAGQLQVAATDFSVSLTVGPVAGAAPDALSLSGSKVTELERAELERTFVRGVRRATEILRPGRVLTEPVQKPRRVEHGALQWIDGHRVATLWGTPEQLGTAHGQLLPEESRRCIESVLYSFGTANVVRTGRWFRHDLQDAYARLSPHIPDRHKRETDALAKSLQLDPETVQVLNVFPELFHCSGFAVFGSATKGGKLYHGRVLDYMTTIGLQDAATTFVVRPDGYFSFANVGYAGFVGSVSGMNAEKISLGEMGGRGEGQWDGAPMATLMRRALEECDTLAEVQQLWTDSPRTCEYYYVFADGETNEAVGVAATPQSIEFIRSGQGHAQLGAGIADSVVLSAGSRLEELRRRVTEKHGQIDTELAQWLMSRPVAMSSNLHNVLFVPQDGLLYVANASHTKPAAEMPYVKVDLYGLLKQAGTPVSDSTAGR